MASTTFAIPANYGYILLAATGSVFINLWHGVRTGSYRKAARIPYPNAYAPMKEAETSVEKYQFNCAQRSHSNYLEALPNFLVTLFIGGLSHPKVAAGLGGIWCLGRVVYAIGYTRPQMDGGKGRLNASFQYIGTLGLLGLSLNSVYQMVV